MFAKHKDKILRYLRAGEEIAYAPGFVRDLATGEYTSIELVSYADEESEWTSEDREIYYTVESDEKAVPGGFGEENSWKLFECLENEIVRRV